MGSRLLQWSPSGAQPVGSTVIFTLRPRRAEGFSAAHLTLTFEQREGEVREYDLPWTGWEGDRDRFSLAVTLPEDYVGLVWCTCRLTGFHGRSREEAQVQLTVYDPGYPVPGWFGEGVTYQIFPDRFCRSAIPDPTGMVGGRTVHRHWEEPMDWRPNERGEVRNRDFFGGDLKGITEKLPYLASLGVETLYLCPIFEGAENHRYGTGDYEKIDPMLGTEEDFRALCRAAHGLGIRVILDGVFNHVGYESRYFGGGDSYPQSKGAARVPDSPYADWFHFTRWPDQYECWWGIYSLPAVNEHSEHYRRYIFGGEDSIVRRWLRAGADGWRLDVADELPDDFIFALRQAARQEKPEATVLGEVWEDGSNKVAYGVRRAHLWGGHLDGLMNYPFRTALLQALEQEDFSPFVHTMEGLLDHYPPFAVHNAMNSLGTHDTERILTHLGALYAPVPGDKEGRSTFRLPEEARREGEGLLKAAAAILYAFPGSPTLYYGDELGMEGCEDPFNRSTFPWDAPRGELWQRFATLGKLRKERESLRRGALRFLLGSGPLLCFLRSLDGEHTLCAVNLDRRARELPLPDGLWALRCLVGEGRPSEGGLILPARSAALFSAALEEDGSL